MVLGPLIVAACTVCLCCYLIKMRSRLPNPREGTRHPPCLTSFPVVGSLPLLKGDTNDLAQQLMEMSKSLGSVFALYFGSQYTVVLNGADAIRDALVRKSFHFAGRVPFYVEQNYNNVNRKGIAFSPYDDAFRRKHQLYFSILKQFGFGQRLMETRINESVEEFIKLVKTIDGRPFNPSQTITLNILNIIASIIIGHRFPLGHQTLIDIKTQMQEWTSGLGAGADFFPLLRFVPPFRGRMYSSIAAHKLLLKTLDETISDALTTEDGDENDSFIRQVTKSTKSREMNRHTTLQSDVGHDDLKKRPPVVIDHEELLYTVRDFIAGGTDTTATTTCWFLILMANHPEVQTRMQKEIDDVVGRERLPSLDDERSMPYSQAVILETMRRHTLVPLPEFHSTTCDTDVKDIFVPANTMVIVNLYSAHMDPTVWEDPSVFRPERFLDEHGEVYGKERLIPFSLGKRSCPGESLARQELFLFMTGVIQNFDVRPPEELQQITYKEVSAVAVQPTPFEVRMIARLP